MLQSIATADLTGKGLAHVVSVRLIAQAFGERWPDKQEGVWTSSTAPSVGGRRARWRFS